MRKIAKACRNAGVVAALTIANTLHPASSALAQSQRPTAVVELFTSQGCSSCPPADAILDELALSGDVVALAYHVDYWDYLGWRDPLANSANTERQRAYARTLGNNSVYTPQAIINGRSDLNGARKNAVLETIGELNQNGDGLQVGIALYDKGDSIVVRVEGQPENGPALPIDAYIVLVDFLPRTETKITAGENQGRTVVYRNAVKSIRTIGMWQGNPERLELPKSEIMNDKGGCAVLLQTVRENGTPGAIFGAAILSGSSD